MKRFDLIKDKEEIINAIENRQEFLLALDQASSGSISYGVMGEGLWITHPGSPVEYPRSEYEKLFYYLTSTFTFFLVPDFGKTQQWWLWNNYELSIVDRHSSPVEILFRVKPA